MTSSGGSGQGKAWHSWGPDLAQPHLGPGSVRGEQSRPVLPVRAARLHVGEEEVYPVPPVPAPVGAAPGLDA